MVRQIYGFTTKTRYDDVDAYRVFTKNTNVDFLIDLYQAADYYEVEDLRYEVVPHIGLKLASALEHRNFDQFADEFCGYKTFTKTSARGCVTTFMVKHAEQLFQQQDLMKRLIRRQPFFVSTMESLGIWRIDLIRGQNVILVCDSRMAWDWCCKGCFLCK